MAVNPKPSDADAPSAAAPLEATETASARTLETIRKSLDFAEKGSVADRIAEMDGSLGTESTPGTVAYHVAQILKQFDPKDASSAVAALSAIQASLTRLEDALPSSGPWRARLDRELQFQLAETQLALGLNKLDQADRDALAELEKKIQAEIVALAGRPNSDERQATADVEAAVAEFARVRHQLLARRRA